MTDQEQEIVARAMEWDNLPFIHILAQYAWHSEVAIYGTTNGLQALSDAILRAIEAGKSECKAVVRDGEGYRIEIKRTNATGMRYVRLPYLDQYAGESNALHLKRLEEEIESLRSAIAEKDEALDRIAQIKGYDSNLVKVREIASSARSLIPESNNGGAAITAPDSHRAKNAGEVVQRQVPAKATIQTKKEAVTK